MQAPARPTIKVTERPTIAELALRLTGSKPESEARLESCIVNILRRMAHVNVADFDAYLAKVASNPTELGQLVSALTIHHTSWFREAVHLDRLKAYAQEFARNLNNRATVFTVLSAGCSTGEEGYSIGLVLERIRAEYPSFDYRIEGWDVDPVSVGTANRAVYSEAILSSVPTTFHKHLMVGTGKTKGYVTLEKCIRDRCSFKPRSLLMPNESAFLKFQVVFCRNVLIYFKPDQVQSIILSLIGRLNGAGLLILGHSEAIEAKSFGLEGLGNSCYRVASGTGAAKAVSPRALTQAQAAPLVVKRPMGKLATESLSLVKPSLILIGASTGGTDALERLLKDMPEDCPPIVVVQHIAHAFARSFAERLAAAAKLKVGNPHESGLIKPNHLYMSWGDYHIGVRRHGSSYVLTVSSDPARHSVRPSVDHLFESAARSEGCENILVCLMTGMGKDGATGMLELRRLGAMTCTQDEKSSVVYGMPAEAVALGASQFAGTPEDVRNIILKALAIPTPTPSKIAAGA